ncbi:alpha/beta hydrolase [Aestuariibius sp. 2305UL40-4]|uniref:alpha/beta hydrolase n=1 Tax=Aestuariibius violaceus TaxID=3234132 RepID=UPI00345F0A03
MRWLVLLVCLLSACAPRGALVPAAIAPTEVTRDVYIATTRVLTTPLEAGPTRSLNLSYARVKLAFPENRNPGDLGTPGRRPDPTSDIVAVESERLADGQAFQARVARALQALPRGQRDAVIYIHGYNNTYGEGVLRVAQLTEDINANVVSLHYAWPSQANPLGYGRDRESALFARDGLERMIREVRQAGADSLMLVAHSLGSHVVVETLRQIDIAQPGEADALVDEVVLFSPDIDPEVFVSQLRRFRTVPEPFVIFASERDRALRLSARLNGSGRRLGNIPDIQTLAAFPVTVVDVTSFSRGVGHFVPGDSEVLLQLFANAERVDQAFAGEGAGRPGLLPGTVLTIQNATEIILTPVQSLN